MNFKSYEKITRVLTESTRVTSILEEKYRPEIFKKIVHILKEYSHSPLCRYIINRIHNPQTNIIEQLEIGKVSKLKIYNLDPIVYDLLLNITQGDIGKGEILISLVYGDWNGGAGNGFDVTLENIGPVELKYLSPFAKSTNVPMGSAKSKKIENSDLPILFNNINNIIRKDPSILKKYLTPEELEYFIDNTIDQLTLDGGSMSTNSLRLIGRLLNKSEQHGNNEFKNSNISFDRFKQNLMQSLLDAMGDVEYIMFIGDIERDNTTYDGMYYIMPKENIKYWNFYRLYDTNRIKIAPFTTEKEFFNVHIYSNEEN